VELAIILPAIFTILWGTVSVFDVLQVAWALNDAAGVGAEAWSASASQAAALTAVRSSLIGSGVNPVHGGRSGLTSDTHRSGTVPRDRRGGARPRTPLGVLGAIFNGPPAPLAGILPILPPSLREGRLVPAGRHGG
jgi:hypothetical protein